MEKDSFDGKTDLQKGGKGVSLQIASLDANIREGIESTKNRDTRQVKKCMTRFSRLAMFCDLLLDRRLYKLC